jgi:hypothetical protein
MKKNHLKLDVNSPFYRVCPYPPCSKAFMTSNGRIYDSDKCADDHYNYYRKLKKLTGKNEKEEPEEEVSITLDLEPISPPKEQPEPTSCEPNEEIIKRNIEIFSRLTIDQGDGSIYNIHQLESLGVDFNHYSYSFPLCNTTNSYCVLFGDYETFLVTPTQVLIYFKPENK